MRLLDVNYHVVNMAADICDQLEVGSKYVAEDCRAWRSHRLELINNWLHSEEVSCKDIFRKDLVRVNMGVDDAVRRVKYEFHRARVLSES